MNPYEITNVDLDDDTYGDDDPAFPAEEAPTKDAPKLPPPDHEPLATE